MAGITILFRLTSVKYLIKSLTACLYMNYQNIHLIAWLLTGLRSGLLAECLSSQLMAKHRKNFQCSLVSRLCPTGYVLEPLFAIHYWPTVKGLYADDTLLVWNWSEALQSDWAGCYGMKFNPAKYTHVRLGEGAPNFSLVLDGSETLHDIKLKYLEWHRFFAQLKYTHTQQMPWEKPIISC